MEVSIMTRRQIRHCHADGITIAELAEFLNLSRSTIKRVLAGTHMDTLDSRAGMMGPWLGGATLDDGCRHSSVPENSLVPDAQIDNDDPLSLLLAEEAVALRKLEKEDEEN